MTGTNHDEPEVRHALRRLLADEPGFVLGVDEVVRDGRRLRRRHRSVRIGLPVAVLAVVATAGGVVLAGGTPTHEPSAPAYVAAAASLPLTDAGKAADPVSADPTTAHGRALMAAISGASPDGWVFDLDQTDIGVPSLDGTVDDGIAPASLSVSVTNTPGMLTVHPCGDPEFVAGGACHETTLADGSHLNVRGVVDYKGIRTIIVSITRDDGTGTFAEAGNYTLPPMPKVLPTISSAAQKKQLVARYGPVISRPHPVYDTAALTAVIKAVEAVSRDWKTAPYKTSGR